ncbi:TonB-dependent receptor [Pseudopedobacter beijingensis]|uniref:TonB-dependent receptor n=1 Tax=Pseudopedobacter beijingensis TaxID=1207056 RepID=A0ABW4IFC7_9SPHI
MEISKQSGYTFIYDEKDLTDIRSISIQMKDKTVAEALDVLFEGQPLQYQVRGKSIAITYKALLPSQNLKQPLKSEQGNLIRGRVTDEKGEPLAGVAVLIKGTTIGTNTDQDGSYTIVSPTPGNILIFRLVGHITQEVSIEEKTDISIVLKVMESRLDEIVVIGYGTQKKSVVTAAISRVSADDIKNTAPVRVDNVLKGLASGIIVTQSSGQPGEGSKVRIRGIGTINNSDPLYIIDGMPIEGGIDYLNPSDISSIEVLKDAASGAVYGARAANGVILVTTKNGTVGKTQVNYNFSMGYQNPWKKRDVLNATEYAIIMNEGLLNSGQNIRYPDPYSYGNGTDWQDLVFNKNAPVSNHQLSVSGANEKVNYFISAGYFDQEGIVGGNWDRSNYNRMTLRSNTLFYLLDNKERNYLNKFTLGVNVSYARTKSIGIATNSEYGSPLGSAIVFSPLLGAYEENPDAALAQHPYAVKDPKTGQVYTIAGSDYNEITNPLAQLALPGEKGNSDKFISNFWAELGLWDNLKIKSSFGTDLAFWGNDGWTPKYYLGQSRYADHSSVWSSMNRSIVWQLENVLSYEKSFLDKHNIQVLIGQSAKKTTGRNIGGANRDLIEENGNKANINFATGTAANGDQSVYGGAFNPHTLASLFSRISYNFNERYIFQATIRRDGSSNFGTNNRYAIFPSLSAGWNITNEQFMDERPDWLSFLKLRTSWGKNGNESIGAFRYIALTSSGNNYPFGKGDGVLYTGTKPSGLANPDLKWEESVQTDVGLDFGFFHNALNFTVDYFYKKTNGMLMTMSIPSYVGEAKPIGNVGEMDNKGVEFETTYRFNTGKWGFRLGANASYIKNKMLRLGNEEGFSNYDYYQNVGTISRAENGYPFPYFYGYQANGIFQNWDEINNYVNKEGKVIQPKAVPGDVRFIDINGDGKISDDDRTIIGNGNPDWTFGFNTNITWKGFDLSFMLQGTIGNDIYDATRRTDISYINLPSYMLNRWTGEGTSNTIPRFSFTDENGNWLSSSLFVKDGSYMRLKNLVLGYSLPNHLTRKYFVSNLRIFASAENLLTLTKYEGLDPEISSGGTSLGIDRGIYPQARTYSFGLNISF